MKQVLPVFFILLGFCASAQIDVLTDIKLKLENYAKSFPSEKLYVHTDKNFYTTGEIVWFKIYQLDSSLNKYGISSKVAYIEILDENRRPVVQTKIEMDERSGNGAIDLPLTLNSGNYTLRAYTNWLKNFGPSQFFEKKITLVNPLKSLDIQDASLTHGSIDLFPEGGNLVNGISSQIAFQVNNSDGKGASGTGFLLNERNDTLLSFTPYESGLGSFVFTPDISHSYKVVFAFADNSLVAKPLPLIYKEGYVMHVEEQDQKIKVQVHSNISSGNSEVFLIGQNKRTVRAAKRNILSNGVVDFLIDRSELGPGVSQLTVFNSEKQPVCERLFFIPPSEKTMVTAITSKEFYGNREQVSLTIASSQPANLSVSVYQFDSLQGDHSFDIGTYFWLESELNGKIENPYYYLSGNTENVKKAADYLMLTHGWRRFNWNTVLNLTPVIQYSPEVSGQIVTCKVVDALGNPAKNVQIFLSIPETSYKLYTGESNDSGIAKINVWDFYGKAGMILQAKEMREHLKIEVIKPFFTQYEENHYPSFVISPDKKSLLENYSVAMQSQHIYIADSLQRFSVPDIKDTFPFFGKALYTYNLDDYTRFTTMEEVLREYVREINVGVKGSGNLVFKLLNEDYKTFYSDNVLLLVDGVPVFDYNNIFSVDPLKIRKIELITKNYFFGNTFFYGLANFSTYSGNHDGIDIDPGTISLDYEGLQIKREFYSPDYSTGQKHDSRIPDLRNTLFWSPDVTINQPIRFYSGDNKGRYLVVVQGISRDGTPVSTVSEFEVK